MLLEGCIFFILFVGGLGIKFIKKNVKRWKNGEKGKIFTELRGKNIIFEKRGWGKNILFCASIHPCVVVVVLFQKVVRIFCT